MGGGRYTGFGERGMWTSIHLEEAAAGHEEWISLFIYVSAFLDMQRDKILDS